MKLKQRIVFTFMMSFVLSSTMSGWVTFLNISLNDQFMAHWLKAFLLCWPAAAVIAFTCTPTIHRLSGQVVDRLEKGVEKCGVRAGGECS
ncbi:DUF2798 domain-containing protein [Marinobacterium mangrovicola]|uniref:Uncharacterized protein DUF2798 n=1 Tax=Marinobacterium mangrovicola TaxID=1476959 RepID=A0A4R1G8N1_9GAMM|nr:DUF2798 domain-containing protein [Marinobacterium mangrovicola]TCK04214.1 uncharacterized protein DUF2798 [Marinobacterium mangrovicola]